MTRRSRRVRPRSVSFSGIDGAGKTTQIRALSRFFADQGLKVRVIPFWDEVAALTGLREEAGYRIFKGDRGVGTPGAPVNRRDKNVQSPVMTCLRLFLYLLDALSLRQVMHRALGSKIDLLVFDRWVYDEFANLNLTNPVLRVYVRVTLALVPRPDLSFLLDADPGEARARKPEYPLEFLVRNRLAYLELQDLIGTMTVIPSTSAENAIREIRTHVRATLLSKGRPSPNREADRTGVSEPDTPGEPSGRFAHGVEFAARERASQTRSCPTGGTGEPSR
jgi:thymidylate kinase